MRLNRTLVQSWWGRAKPHGDLRAKVLLNGAPRGVVPCRLNVEPSGAAQLITADGRLPLPGGCAVVTLVWRCAQHLELHAATARDPAGEGAG